MTSKIRVLRRINFKSTLAQYPIDDVDPHSKRLHVASWQTLWHMHRPETKHDKVSPFRPMYLPYPEGPCIHIGSTWALKGSMYGYFRAQVYDM